MISEIPIALLIQYDGLDSQVNVTLELYRHRIIEAVLQTGTFNIDHL